MQGHRKVGGACQETCTGDGGALGVDEPPCHDADRAKSDCACELLLSESDRRIAIAEAFRLFDSIVKRRFSNRSRKFYPLALKFDL